MQDVAAWPGTTVIRLEPGPGGRRARIREILRSARSHDLVLLSGTVSLTQWYDQMLLAGFLARVRPNKCVVLDGCYWEEGTRALDLDRRLAGRRSVAVNPPARRGRLLARSLIRWVNHPSVYYVVYSSEERSVFPLRWGIPSERVFVLNYHAHTWTEHVNPDDAGNADYVFAGGGSLRDYRPLLAAAPMIPAPVRIASGIAMPPLPSNVTSAQYPQHDFEMLATHAAVHVVPMVGQAPRSSGQASYLDALMLGIPVVVTDGPGVRDHLRPDHEALIVPPDDAAALASAVVRCLSDADVRKRLRINGRRRALCEYTLARFRDRQYRQLLSIWERHITTPQFMPGGSSRFVPSGSSSLTVTE